MIPKTIHYCWFGRNPLPPSAQKCIASWHKFLPDYKIKEWNEDNFDVNIIPYTQQAYEAKKYAFVSDYARFWVLYHYGGVYFDTDVEVIKPLDDIIEKGPFMGIEATASLTKKSTSAEVAPGLGMAAIVNQEFLYKLLERYHNTEFILSDGSFNQITIVKYTTELLKVNGFNEKDEIQQVAEFTIYPSDFFCPMDSTTGIITKTSNTRTIHHYDCSWIDHNSFSYKIHLFKNIIYRTLGASAARKLHRMLHS